MIGAMHELPPQEAFSAENQSPVSNGALSMAESFSGSGIVERDFSELIELRTDFVRKMGWIGEGQRDGDDYDLLSDTKHYFWRDETGEIASTMRLTGPFSASSLDEVLSLQMLSGNDRMHREAKKGLEGLAAESPNVQLYDLTRLVSREGVDRRELADAMMRMFVPAMNDTAPIDGAGSHDVVWVFSSILSMRRMLDRMGISCTVLTRGLVSEKDSQTHGDTEFCYIRPHEATEKALAESESLRPYILGGQAVRNSL